jgi:hypothetical protein
MSRFTLRNLSKLDDRDWELLAGLIGDQPFWTPERLKSYCLKRQDRETAVEVEHVLGDAAAVPDDADPDLLDENLEFVQKLRDDLRQIVEGAKRLANDPHSDTSDLDKALDGITALLADLCERLGIPFNDDDDDDDVDPDWTYGDLPWRKPK